MSLSSWKTNALRPSSTTRCRFTDTHPSFLSDFFILLDSPAGGQGLNLGVIDALTLGTTLATILSLPPSPGLQHDVDHRLGDQWSVARRNRAEKVVQFTDRATRMTTISNPILIWLRNRLLRFMSYWFPHVMRRGTFDMSGLQR